MKILVVQLMRLGDILLSAPVINGLKQANRGADIHVLAFRQFSHVKELFDESIQWHWIDRDGLQAAIGDPESSFLRPYDMLAQQLSTAAGSEWDIIYNLTQTKWSGWICAGLKAKQKIGLHFDERGEARFGSPWFQYLNDHAGVFHFTDIFRYACGLDRFSAEWNLRRAPVAAIRGPYVIIQPLTSDPKKNFPIAQWRRAIEIFRMANSEYHVAILAAPHEEDRLKAEFAGVTGTEVRVCSLPEALSLMDSARLLVTGDTSIKHLACAALLPVLEISIGGSDYRKTGTYKTGSFILQGRTACAPCPHSSPCSQKTHACAENVTPEAVAVAMHLLLKGNTDRKKSEIVREFSSQIQWLETCISPMGFWMVKDMSAATPEWELMQCIEKSTWKFMLQREFQNPLAPFGTEGLMIQRTFSDRLSDSVIPRIQDQLEFLESETASTDRSLGVLKQSMDRLLEKPLDADRQEACMESVREFCERESGSSGSVFGGLLAAVATPASGPTGLWPTRGEKVVPLTPIRRLQTQLDEINRRTQIKLKLIRSVQAQLKDVN